MKNYFSQSKNSKNKAVKTAKKFPLAGTDHRAPITEGFRAALVALFLIIGAIVLLPMHSASANGIRMAPLEYQTSLNGQLKKGAVDISNPSDDTQDVTMQVQAFKQVDSKGTLQFYDDPIISAGITPDYQHFQLKPHESIHLFFQLNGKKLPKTRVFAALLSQAKPTKASYNITPVLRVGTLLILKNGNGDPPKQGRISNWHVGLFQFGHNVSGSFDFKNTEAGQDASGYFPNFKVQLAGSTQKLNGDLVFPGIQRQQSFSLSGSHIGIYKLQLTSDASASASQRLVVLTGYWRWLLPLLIILVIGLTILAVRLLKRRNSNRR